MFFVCFSVSLSPRNEEEDRFIKTIKKHWKLFDLGFLTTFKWNWIGYISLCHSFPHREFSCILFFFIWCLLNSISITSPYFDDDDDIHHNKLFFSSLALSLSPIDCVCMCCSTWKIIPAISMLIHFDIFVSVRYSFMCKSWIWMRIPCRFIKTNQQNVLYPFFFFVVVLRFVLFSSELVLTAQYS